MYDKPAEMRLTLLEAKLTDLGHYPSPDWGTQTQSIDLCTYSKMLTVIFIWCYVALVFYSVSAVACFRVQTWRTDQHFASYFAEIVIVSFPFCLRPLLLGLIRAHLSVSKHKHCLFYWNFQQRQQPITQRRLAWESDQANSLRNAVFATLFVFLDIMMLFKYYDTFLA